MTNAPPSSIKLPAVVGLALAVGGLIALSWWMGQQAYHWLPVQASTAAPLVDGLFSFETALGTFVFGGVTAVMLWVIVMHRADKYDESDAVPGRSISRDLAPDESSWATASPERLVAATDCGLVPVTMSVPAAAGEAAGRPIAPTGQ